MAGHTRVHSHLLTVQRCQFALPHVFGVREELKNACGDHGSCTRIQSGAMNYNPGQDDYDRLRPLSYQDANVVLICYDVTNPTSFDNVLSKWYPEVNHFCKGVPIILIGCKTDLRKDKEKTRKLKALDQAPITYLQGQEVREQINAELYVECSAKYRENVEDIFLEATKLALVAKRKARQGKRKKRVCIIL